MKFIRQLASSWRIWTLLSICASGVTGFAAYRLYVLRPVIRSINAVGGICDLDQSTRVVPYFQSWLAIDTDIQRICIEFSHIPDPIRQHLHELPKLGRFIMVRSPVNDSDLEALGNATGLTDIGFGSCRFIDADLGRLSRLKTLRSLGFQASGVTDSDLEHVTAIHSLEQLSIPDSPISDAGLAHLHRLPQLNRLDLSGTAITDTGLARLAGIKRLQLLDVQRTAITPTGIADLKKVLPDCNVIGP